jgi:hypothetical protein
LYKKIFLWSISSSRRLIPSTWSTINGFSLYLKGKKLITKLWTIIIDTICTPIMWSIFVQLYNDNISFQSPIHTKNSPYQLYCSIRCLSCTILIKKCWVMMGIIHIELRAVIQVSWPTHVYESFSKRVGHSLDKL